MPSSTLIVRLTSSAHSTQLAGVLIASGADAAPTFAAHKLLPGTHLLLAGDRDYFVTLSDQPTRAQQRSLETRRGNGSVFVIFEARTAVRRRLADLAIGGTAAPAPPPGSLPAPPPAEAVASTALDLMAGLPDAPPLFLLPTGEFSVTASDPAKLGMQAAPALVNAARWITTRRTSSFERLFPPSAFHPDVPLRPERLSEKQAEALLLQVDTVLREAVVGGAAAQADAQAAAQARSACVTVLSHLVATVRKDASFRSLADRAAERVFTLIDQEQGQASARGALRSHAIQLMQMRAPSLSDAHKGRAAGLLKTLLRSAPPYADLPSTWRFAMCSAWDFHDGECELLGRKYGFKEIPMPADVTGLGATPYRVFEAPMRGPQGQAILVFSRTATPGDENQEMGRADFTGVLINRHAQLGAFDMQASLSQVRQVGYKLMMNSQCAGLTTRFAIGKLFPDADIYSSWDSTYFRTNPTSGKVSDSEGLDCFVALLTGMSKGETHAQISARMKAVQWHHEQASDPSFSQFVGPAHPVVISKFSDVNQDGKADYYDGFLDLYLKDIQLDIEHGSTPKDPGVTPSQVAGEAAKGLGWAAGSLNRVTQYSDLWRGLPGESELFYIFSAAGFYSHAEPPKDVPVAPGTLEPELGRLPAICRFLREREETGKPGLRVEVMFHSFLAHSAWELKRLLCAAEGMRRALDLEILPPTGGLATQVGQRGALLLMLAGLLEFPADQNRIDGLWSTTLRMLNLPMVSRSLVRGCITDADHNASNYYGSARGLKQLIGDGTDASGGDLKRADPLAFGKLIDPDPRIGRALPLEL
jgi:hypothetical protein